MKVISACETASCWALSLLLLDILVMPDVVSFSAAISACGKAKETRTKTCFDLLISLTDGR